MLFNPGLFEFDDAAATAPMTSAAVGCAPTADLRGPLAGSDNRVTPDTPVGRPELVVWRPRTMHEWLT